MRTVSLVLLGACTRSPVGSIAPVATSTTTAHAAVSATPTTLVSTAGPPTASVSIDGPFYPLALGERLAREASARSAGELDRGPFPADPERDRAIRGRFGRECRLERTCGPLWGVDCNAASDGPYFYVRPTKLTLQEIAVCGGVCMGGRCTNCPPKAEGWTCETW